MSSPLDFLLIWNWPPLYSAAALLVLGLIVGSFLNVVIWRTNAPLLGQVNIGTLWSPRSYCPLCRQRLVWWQLLPLLSFLILRGHCHGCKQPISWQYPLIEALSAALFVAIGWYFAFSPNLELLFWLVFASLALALCVSDWRWTLLPDHLTLSLLWIGLLTNSLEVFTSLSSAVYGAAVGFCLLWSVNALYKLIRKREGMGGGDQKLLAALGACFGLEAVWPTLLFAALGGCAQALAIYLVSRRAPIVIFGPWLLAAAVLYHFLASYYWPF